MSEWRSIDTVPKDGRFVLLKFPPSYDSPGVAVGAWVIKEWWLTAIWAGTSSHVEPTHWSPLPATEQPELGMVMPEGDDR